MKSLKNQIESILAEVEVKSINFKNEDGINTICLLGDIHPAIIAGLYLKTQSVKTEVPEEVILCFSITNNNAHLVYQMENVVKDFTVNDDIAVLGVVSYEVEGSL